MTAAIVLSSMVFSTGWSGRRSTGERHGIRVPGTRAGKATRFLRVHQSLIGTALLLAVFSLVIGVLSTAAA